MNVIPRTAPSHFWQDKVKYVVWGCSIECRCYRAFIGETRWDQHGAETLTCQPVELFFCHVLLHTPLTVAYKALDRTKVSPSSAMRPGGAINPSMPPGGGGRSRVVR